MKREHRKITLDDATEITPELAYDWFTNHNKNNYRPFSIALAKTYAGFITKGLWDADAQTISFDTSGNVCDGQHRLWAIWLAQKSLKILVVYGLEKNLVNTDTGKKRKLSNELRRRGFKNASMLSATLGYVYMHNKSPDVWVLAQRVPRMELISLLESEEKALLYSVGSINRYGVGGLLRNGLGCLTHFLFSKAADRDQADKFFAEFHDQINMVKNDPARVLRERLERGAKKQMYGLGPREKCALTIRAWNFWVRGNKCTILRWRPKHDEFPQVEGPEV